MASQGEEVLVFTDPYLSAGAQGEDKGLIEKIFFIDMDWGLWLNCGVVVYPTIGKFIIS